MDLVALKRSLGFACALRIRHMTDFYKIMILLRDILWFVYKVYVQQNKYVCSTVGLLNFLLPMYEVLLGPGLN